MITWNINEKKVLCPSCYEKLTTGAYQKALRWDDEIPDVADRDFLKLFCILTGTDYAGIVKTPENEVTIWNAVHWYVTQPFEFTSSLPKVIEISGRMIEVPGTVGALSIGQMIHIRRAIQQSKYLGENIAFAVAVVMQPVFDEKPFNIERTRELENEILEMPISVTYPIGFFLLEAAERFGRKPMINWRQIQSSLTKSLKTMWPKWPTLGDLGNSTTST